MVRFAYIFFSIFFWLSVTAADPLSAQDHPDFNADETLRYKAYFQWGFIWLHAGDVVFTAKPRTENDTALVDFISTGSSLKPYDLFFKVRDRFESTATSKDLVPLEFYRNTREGKQKVEHSYWFKWNQAAIHTWTRDQEVGIIRDTLLLKPGTRDVLTSIYYCRTLDYPQMETGQGIPLTMIIDRKVYDLNLVYEGREVVQIGNGKKQSCFKISIQLEKGTLFKGGETLSAWITADALRIPLVVESTIIIGSIKAVLSEQVGSHF